MQLYTWDIFYLLAQRHLRLSVCPPHPYACSSVRHIYIYYGGDMQPYLQIWTTQYVEDSVQKRRSKYAVQLAPLQRRTNSLKTSVWDSLHRYLGISRNSKHISVNTYVCAFKRHISMRALKLNGRNGHRTHDSRWHHCHLVLCRINIHRKIV